MKKFVCLFSLALLCSTSLSAQTVDTSLSKGKAPITEEDVQTIFFSEDLLDELSNIPAAPLLEDEPALPAASPAPKAQISPAQTAETKNIPSAAETLPQQNTNLPAAAALPAKPQTAPQEALPEDKDKTSQVGSSLVPEDKTEMINPAKEIKAEAPAPQQTMPQPKQDLLPEENMPKENLPLQKTEPEIKEIPLEKEQPKEPTIQEQIELPKMSFPRQPVEEPKPQQPAPKPKKKNAFSLDDKAPLPAALLQDDGLATNMIDRGIRISPEQRAKMMMKKKYDEMDINHNGIVSRDEFVTYKTLEAQRIAEQVFDQIDTNADAKISDAEYDVLMNKMIENYIRPLKST